MYRALAKYCLAMALLGLVISCSKKSIFPTIVATMPGSMQISLTGTHLEPTRLPTGLDNTPTPAQTPSPTSLLPIQNPPTPSIILPGLIVFYSERDGNAEIYLMNADGSDQRRLTKNQTNEFAPSWSPDGKHIVIETDRDDLNPVECFPNCIWKLYRMNTDGSNWQQLMNLPGSESHADWSPNGEKIVFDADRNSDGKGEIYILNARGGMPIVVLADNYDNRFPVWSPDGKIIAFSSDRDGNPDIFTVDITSGQFHKVVNTGLNDYLPDWSPNGKQIVFFATKWPNQKQDIFLVNSDGSNLIRLTNTPSIVDEDPRWSPDGNKIVFQSDRDGNFDIYIMNPDGSNQQNITHNPAQDYEPNWWMSEQELLQP